MVFFIVLLIVAAVIIGRLVSIYEGATINNAPRHKSNANVFLGLAWTWILAFTIILFVTNGIGPSLLQAITHGATGHTVGLIIKGLVCLGLGVYLVFGFRYKPYPIYAGVYLAGRPVCIFFPGVNLSLPGLVREDHYDGSNGSAVQDITDMMEGKSEAEIKKVTREELTTPEVSGMGGIIADVAGHTIGVGAETSLYLDIFSFTGNGWGHLAQPSAARTHWWRGPKAEADRIWRELAINIPLEILQRIDSQSFLWGDPRRIIEFMKQQLPRLQALPRLEDAVLVGIWSEFRTADRIPEEKDVLEGGSFDQKKFEALLAERPNSLAALCVAYGEFIYALRIIDVNLPQEVRDAISAATAEAARVAEMEAAGKSVGVEAETIVRTAVGEQPHKDVPPASLTDEQRGDIAEYRATVMKMAQLLVSARIVGKNSVVFAQSPPGLTLALTGGGNDDAKPKSGK